MRNAQLTLIATWFLAWAAPAQAAEYYYYGDSAISLSPSDKAVAVQLDTTMGVLDLAAFFNSHPCLDSVAGRKYIARGFYRYLLREGCGHVAAEASLRTDSIVNRVIPVYLDSDSEEVMVTDLVSIKLSPTAVTSSALAALADVGLVFHDSIRFVRNLWQASLADSAKGSPLSAAARLRLQSGVIWAVPTFYSGSAGLDADPADNYFPNQYYLKNTGDVDINADSAWMIPLVDPNIIVAVIDDGLEPHLDLPASRILPGYSVVGPGVPTDVTPAHTDAHGMEVTGILAAAQNDTGIVGVMRSCRIYPVRRFYDTIMASDLDVAHAIYAAIESGAKVISCSWHWSMKSPDSLIENAIKSGTDTSQSSPLQFTRVFVFSAGNYRQYPPWPNVLWPASMPEVLAVGAMRRDGYWWDYSSCGAALDVMAPSGDCDYLGDVWTTDRMGWNGENPLITQQFGDTWDYDYTKLFGGTSAACPQVAGIAALVLARRPDLLGKMTYPIIQKIIDSSAVNWYTPGRDDSTGYGLANAYRALLSVIHGDVNNDGIYNVNDVLKESQILYQNGHATLDDRTADVNCDGVLNVSDQMYLITFVFSNGPWPPICFRY